MSHAPAPRRRLRADVVEPERVSAAGLAPVATTPLAVDLEDAARLIGMSARWLRRAAAAGDIPYARLGRALRFRPEDLRALVDRHVIGGAA
ncbi:MAG: helix-turn-helix domain-containing protein [Planctomycetia bacterium]|nr:helix-turn-helix domain-containing protein [Planctomycetia bacterium]